MTIEETEELMMFVRRSERLRKLILDLRDIQTGNYSHQTTAPKQLGSFVERDLPIEDNRWLVQLLIERYTLRLDALLMPTLPAQPLDAPT